MANNQ